MVSAQNVNCSSKYNIYFAVIFAEKCEYMQKLLSFFFFSKSIIIYAIFNDQSWRNTLTNDIVSFKQLGLGLPVS